MHWRRCRAAAGPATLAPVSFVRATCRSMDVRRRDDGSASRFQLSFSPASAPSGPASSSLITPAAFSAAAAPGPRGKGSSASAIVSAAASPRSIAPPSIEHHVEVAVAQLDLLARRSSLVATNRSATGSSIVAGNGSPVTLHACITAASTRPSSDDPGCVAADRESAPSAGRSRSARTAWPAPRARLRRPRSRSCAAVADRVEPLGSREFGRVTAGRRRSAGRRSTPANAAAQREQFALDMRQRRVAGRLAAIEVADQRGLRSPAASPSRYAPSRPPSIPIIRPICLPTSDVADPDLAQLRVHVVDERFGQLRRRRRAPAGSSSSRSITIASTAAIMSNRPSTCRDAARDIPMRRPRARHHCCVQRGAFRRASRLNIGRKNPSIVPWRRGLVPPRMLRILRRSARDAIAGRVPSVTRGRI